MPRDQLIAVRQGTAAEWTALNPTLLAGEPGYERDTGLWKWGDGVTRWSSLAYQPSGGGSLYARKPADTTRNNTAVLAADPHLSVAVASGGVYLVELLIFYSSTTVADLQIGWTAPVGSTFEWSPDTLSVSATSATGQVGRPRATMTGVGVGGGIGASTGSRVVGRPTGVLIAGADGTLELTWAQNTAEVSDTVVYAPSLLKVTRI